MTFKEWLANDDCTYFDINIEHGWRDRITKVKINDDFKLLYSQYVNDIHGMTQDKEFRFCGIYYNTDGLVYDPGFVISRSDVEISHIVGLFDERVRARIDKLVDNNVDNLPIHKITSESGAEQYEYYLRYQADEDARRAFFTDGYEKLECHCTYYDENPMATDKVFDYIRNPEAFIESAAREYIQKNGEKILISVLKAKAVNETLKAIEADKGNNIHLIKRICKAMRAEPLANTVKVTVEIDGVIHEFPYPHNSLCVDPLYSYKMWNTTKSEANRFRNIFKCSEFKPEEIVQITYRKNVLYSKEDVR